MAFASALKISSNHNLNRLAAHTMLHQLAWSISSVFSPAFLLHQGLSPAAVFLSFALIIAGRFTFRGLVLLSVTRIGVRMTMIIGTFLYGVQSPLLAIVHGPGAALVLYCLGSALAQAFYWTCYQTTFAAAGDVESRGHQIGWRQALIAVASIVGPAAGGIILATSGPWAAFGVAAVIEFGAIIPLLRVGKITVPRFAPKGAYPTAWRGALLLASDGRIFNSSGWVWVMVMFQALSSRFDAFGGSIAVATFAGALGGIVLGHFIDIGHGPRASILTAGWLAASLFIKALCGSHPVAIVAVAIGTSLFSGLYVPTLMTAVYNEGKRAPCTFRFQFTAEAGWDIGGGLACLTVALLSALGAPLQRIILLALPAVALQAYTLTGSYAALKGDP